MNEQLKINWYRTPVDKAVMSELMNRSNARGLVQSLLHLVLFAATTAASYIAFLQINATTWLWSVPMLVLVLFVHGTFASFMGGLATHELLHKTPFASQRLNDLFLQIFSFFSWYDYVGGRLSHVKHHQVTAHRAQDGEVRLPHNLDWVPVEDDEMVLPERGKWAGFLVGQFLPFPNPVIVWQRLVRWAKFATGQVDNVPMFAGGTRWTNQLLPADKPEGRIKHRNWARIVLGGHFLLSILFIASGHWFLIIPICLSSSYAGWLVSLCALPQHIGMGPDVPDFRLCCRTYTCSRWIGFLYWNMQYHVEHHMFPAVPFYNLPALRKAIEHDLPPVQHGLLATWREILPILRKQNDDTSYFFVPPLPKQQAVI